MTKQVINVGHTKVSDFNANGVYAAAYRFEKRRVIVGRDGSESEIPLTETAYLLKLPGEGRKLWLRASERIRVLEALQEVGPLGKEARQRQLPTYTVEAFEVTATGGEAA